MADKRDIRRRIIGAGFLFGAIGMVVLGQTVLRQWLRAHPADFLLFWMACFVLLSLAILVAILDLAVVRRRLRREQRELLENTLREIERSAKPTKNRPRGKNPE